MNGFMCGPKVYEYKGWLFEMSYFGPWPLKVDGNPRERAGKKFWDMFKEFDKLPDKESYRIGGGCIAI